ncbi:MAG TPA: NUDIX domain-containing protein [Dehalococcoidia bacterium]|nr:NUDIX domain-containing protein [Dehalococcoidia bacterium]
MADPGLRSFLAALQPSARERIEWPEGLSFLVSTYLTPAAPPPAFLSSSRAIVRREASVLVVSDSWGTTHILPGGRLEAGESALDAVHREVAEESGWLIDKLRQIGVLHFHHLQPCPRGYRYLYPDFLQIVFTARAREYDETSRDQGGVEISATFLPVLDVADLPLNLGEQALLQAALQSSPD